MKAQALVSVIGLSGQSLFFQVDHFHQAGETLISECLFVEPGGKGFNQAVALSLLGLKVAFLSAVGNDEYGHQCEQYLVKRGIKAHIVYKQNQQTAIASILRNRDGDNQVTVFPGASLSKDDVDHFTSSLASSKALLLQLEVADEVLRVAVNMASKKHQLIVLNPAPYRVIPEDILHKVDILTPNESEARQMAGLDFSSDWGLVVKKLKQLEKVKILP